MKIIKLTPVLVLMVFFVSCAKMPVYKSQNTDSVPSEFAARTHFDAKSKIDFGFAHNDTSLQVRMIFTEPATLMKIARKGFTVYFDPEAKKNKDISLKMTPANNGQMQSMALNMPAKRDNGVQRNMMQLNQRIAERLTAAVWKTKTDVFAFDPRLSKYPVEVDLFPAEMGQLQLDIKIPISELSASLEELTLLSIGIESERMEQAVMKGNRQMMSGGMGGGMRGGAMGGSRGGMKGGMRGGSMGGGMRGSGTPGGARSMGGSGMETINTWVQVDLSGE